MKRLSISLFAMGCALSANTVAPVKAAEIVGSWQVEAQDDPEIKASCIMQMMASPTTAVFAVVDNDGNVQIGLRKRDRFDFLPTEDPNVELSFDREPAAWHGSSLLMAEVVLTNTPYLASEPDQLEIALRKSRTLDARARGVRVSIVMSATADAIDALRLCEAQADGVVAESQASSSASGLSNAIRGIAGEQPQIAQFQCSITGRDLTGLSDPSGRDRAKTITIGVSEDGSGYINGTAMTSAQVERGDGGDLIGTAFSFQDVNRAISGGASPLPQMGTLTADQNAALQALPGLMNGMLGTVMGDRKRFMVVSLQQNNVVFFDLTPAGKTATLTAPDCIRTQ